MKTALILTLAASFELAALASSTLAADPKPTPAQIKINAVRTVIQKNPDNPRAYSDLAMALALRARETGDPAFYHQADQALDQSLKLAPDNLQALKTRAWVLLGKHQFAKALDAAKAINHKNPDDVIVYGYLADANVELGNYKDAETAAQWMLDIRPGNIPGLTRAAYLRELFGDVTGAIELMLMAYEATPSAESEDKAWILTHVAHLHLSTGNVDYADKILQQALDLFPDYHYALAELANVRTTQGRLEEALTLRQKNGQIQPHPENILYVAQALDRLGRHDQALAAYKQFEEDALKEMPSNDNCNRDLIAYYVDVAHKPQEALKVANLEIQRRRDVGALAAYAWALQATGRYDLARKHIEEALAVGIQDAKLFYQAGVIAAKQNDKHAAREFFNKAINLNPPSHWAAASRRAVTEISSS